MDKNIGGYFFEIFGLIAQSVEQCAVNAKVIGSAPTACIGC